MRRLRKCFFLVAVLLSTPPVEAGAAGSVVVTDIDDTIKISHVLDRWDMLRNATRTDALVIGMNELLSEVVRSANARIVYLSNAPQPVMGGLHAHFLASNGFPEGEIALRPGFGGRETFKLEKLVSLVQSEQPDHLLLIGDNGELDPAIYGELRARFPSLLITTLIHQVYSIHSEKEPGAPLRFGQYGFVTAMDAASLLHQEGWLDEGGLSRLLAHVPAFAAETESAPAAYLPAWARCQDFMEQVTGRDERIPLLAATIRQRCAAR